MFDLALDNYREACIELGQVMERASVLADSPTATLQQLTTVRNELTAARQLVILRRYEVSTSL